MLTDLGDIPDVPIPLPFDSFIIQQIFDIIAGQYISIEKLPLDKVISMVNYINHLEISSLDDLQMKCNKKNK
jgi:hypothetical protein